jgi:cytochrome b6-f complex iron-sulfur subunit
MWSRRDFLTRVGWAGFDFFFSRFARFHSSAFPRVLFQPPSILKVGLPSDYALGEVSEKYKQDYRVWIVREDEGIYALFAKCTHRAARLVGSRQKINSNVLATAVAFTRAV